MKDQHPNPKESEIAGLDQQLDSLKRIHLHGPSLTVRNNLADLHSKRLREASTSGFRHKNHFSWIVWGSGALALIIVVAAVLVRSKRPGQLQADHASRATSPGATLAMGNRPVSASTAAKIVPMHSRRSRPRKARSDAPHVLIVQLPYSNRAIATGTGTTIRVPMSQLELASLGFPVSGVPKDGRVVAELTLGDDGLPRAIGLPVPLEIVKEKR